MVRLRRLSVLFAVVMTVNTSAPKADRFVHPQHGVLLAEVEIDRQPQAQAPGRLDMGERKFSVQCFGDDRHHAVIEGVFVDRNGGDRSQLFLSNRGNDGCYLDFDGRRAQVTAQSAAQFVTTCRDPIAGTEQAVVWLASGKYMGVELWDIHPATFNPRQLYEEGWGELSPDGFLSGFLSEGTDGTFGSDYDDERSNYPFVDADGTCIWQSRQKDRQIFDKAMAELRIGKESHGIFGELRSTDEAGKSRDTSTAADLPIREIPRETAYHSLRDLKDIAVFEGAAYTSDSDRKTWFLVQLFGTWRCDAEGVVLLFHRWTGRWATIYDIPSGCSKSLNFPLRGLLIKDDKLYMSACTDCEPGSLGEYQDFVVDLHTNRVSLFESGTNPVGKRDQDNPVIGNINEALDASAAVAETQAANCAAINRIIASGLDSNTPFATVDALMFENATRCEVVVEEEDATYRCDWGLSDDAEMKQPRGGAGEEISEKLPAQWVKLNSSLEDCFDSQDANGYRSGTIAGSFFVAGDEDDIEIASPTLFWQKPGGCRVSLELPGESGFRLEVTCPYSSE